MLERKTLLVLGQPLVPVPPFRLIRSQHNWPPGTGYQLFTCVLFTKSLFGPMGGDVSIVGSTNLVVPFFFPSKDGGFVPHTQKVKLTIAGPNIVKSWTVEPSEWVARMSRGVREGSWRFNVRTADALS